MVARNPLVDKVVAATPSQARRDGSGHRRTVMSILSSHIQPARHELVEFSSEIFARRVDLHPTHSPLALTRLLMMSCSWLRVSFCSRICFPAQLRSVSGSTCAALPEFSAVYAVQDIHW